MRYMRRRSFVIVMVLIIVLLTGCSERKEMQFVKAEPLMNEDTGVKRKVRSIDELWTHSEPLVRRENVYDLSDGELEEYFVYEYDENNRYTTVLHYEKNEETQEMELIYREDFVYDDYFCYKDTTYAQQNGLLKRYIYDLHGNVILIDRQERGYSDAVTLTYMYRYPVDTETRQEEYCYTGEGAVFGHYTLKLFNEYGDLVYTMIQYDDSLHMENTEYSYDAEGRMETKTITNTIQEIWGEYTTFTDIVYQYDEKGYLITETEVRGVIESEETSIKEVRTYEYDEHGRLIRMKRCYNLIEEYSEETEYGVIIEYEYEI